MKQNRSIYKRASDLKKGDSVYCVDDILKIDGNLEFKNIHKERISKIEYIGVKKVNNLTANKTHTYIANGFITHNTGGQVELSADAQEVASNPEAYGLIAMDWDLLNKHISEPTWKERKFCIFVPAQMSIQEGCLKSPITLSEYLDVKSGSYLDKIKIEVTDFDKSTENIKKRLSDLQAINDKEAYNKSRMYLPLDPLDCFLNTNTNFFPVEFILGHISDLIEKGDTGRAVDIYPKVDGKFGWELSRKSCADFPHKGGNVDAPVLLFEDPDEHFNSFDDYAYACGLDPYKHKGKTSSISLGAFYIVKREVNINDPFANCIVVSFVSRPIDIDHFNSTCMTLQEGYGAMCLQENFDLTYEDYLTHLNKQFRLLHDGEVIVKNQINAKGSQNNRLGLSPTTRHQEYLLKLVVKYANEMVTVSYDDDGNAITRPGAVRIKDIGLLKEMVGYGPHGNFDRILAFGHALALARYYDYMNYIPNAKKDISYDNNEQKKHFKTKNSAYTFRGKKRKYFK